MLIQKCVGVRVHAQKVNKMTISYLFLSPLSLFLIGFLLKTKTIAHHEHGEAYQYIRKGQILDLVLTVVTFIHDDVKQSITNIQAMHQKQEDTNCLHERELDGYWLQDWRYANRTN